jgi:hypothetical protein
VQLSAAARVQQHTGFPIQTSMEFFEFLKYNIVFGAIVLLAGFVYLVILINKRRKNKFLHSKENE